MKRTVILFNCKFKSFVLAYLVHHRVQYSMSVDIYTGDVRVSVPSSKSIPLLTELRHASIPYELV